MLNINIAIRACKFTGLAAVTRFRTFSSSNITMAKAAMVGIMICKKDLQKKLTKLAVSQQLNCVGHDEDYM